MKQTWPRYKQLTDEDFTRLNRKCLECGAKLVRRTDSSMLETLHAFKKRKFCNYDCAGVHRGRQRKAANEQKKLSRLP